MSHSSMDLSEEGLARFGGLFHGGARCEAEVPNRDHHGRATGKVRLPRRSTGQSLLRYPFDFIGDVTNDDVLIQLADT